MQVLVGFILEQIRLFVFSYQSGGYASEHWLTDVFFFFRIKETWITLESLKEDCTFFENWLINIKLEIDSSASDQMNTNFSKEEIQHFEVLLFVGS